MLLFECFLLYGSMHMRGTVIKQRAVEKKMMRAGKRVSPPASSERMPATEAHGIMTVSRMTFPISGFEIGISLRTAQQIRGISSNLHAVPSTASRSRTVSLKDPFPMCIPIKIMESGVERLLMAVNGVIRKDGGVSSAT